MSGKRGLSDTIPRKVIEKPRAAWTIEHLGPWLFGHLPLAEWCLRAWTFEHLAIRHGYHPHTTFHSYPLYVFSLIFQPFNKVIHFSTSGQSNRTWTIGHLSWPFKHHATHSSMRAWTIKHPQYGLSNTFIWGFRHHSVDYRTPRPAGTGYGSKADPTCLYIMHS